MMLSREDIIERLRQIFDPEIPVNIYDLGLIYDVNLQGGKIAVRMTLTTPHCPAAQSLPETVREVLSRTRGIEEVSVEIVWDPPWTRDKISPEGKEILGIS